MEFQRFDTYYKKSFSYLCHMFKNLYEVYIINYIINNK